MSIWVIFEKDESSRSQVGFIEFGEEGTFDIQTDSKNFANFIKEFSISLEEYENHKSEVELLSAESLIDLEMLIAAKIGQKSQWQFIIEPCVHMDDEAEPA